MNIPEPVEVVFFLFPLLKKMVFIFGHIWKRSNDMFLIALHVLSTDKEKYYTEKMQNFNDKKNKFLFISSIILTILWYAIPRNL